MHDRAAKPTTCPGSTRARAAGPTCLNPLRPPRIDHLAGTAKPGRTIWRVGVLAAALVAVSGCKIVEHADETDPGADASQTASAGGTDSAAFDPVRYVEVRWEARILPAAAEQAVDLAEVLAALADDRDAASARFGHREGDEGKPWSFLVVARGTALAVDRSSRAGVMPIDLAPEDGVADAVVQVGPVIRGTALRDALPFLSFADVVNQMEWAAVSRAMHDRLAATVLDPAAIDALAGRRIEVHGAFTAPDDGSAVAITPISIALLD